MPDTHKRNTAKTGKPTKGFVLAATKSGSGKTTITLAFLAALKKRGMAVAPFKVGPDFIDPGHHTRITGRVSRNLDGWMLSRDYNRRCFESHSQDAEIVVVEGVMGLFDGYDGHSEAGSTAQMAKWLGLPVILVVDAKSMARSAAAMVQGFERFDPQVSFAGVIFNNVSSERHLLYLQQALEGHIAMPCLGGIGYNEEVTIPERHLGLYTSADHRLSDETIACLADLVESNLDLDSLLAGLPEISAAQSAGNLEKPPQRTTVARPSGSERPRIGVADDNAFCFYYRDNLDLLEEAGADVVPFSPITDERLPEDLDGLYFGGGYPELFATQLTANRPIREQIRSAGNTGMPIYGECGGFMYLGQAIANQHDQHYEMVGIFPVTTMMSPKLRSLGYREVQLTADTPIGLSGQTMRGHEFHYSALTPDSPPLESVYRVQTRVGVEKPAGGYRIGRCLGSYVHLHFGSCPDIAQRFVTNCKTYHMERSNPHET